MNNLYKKNYNHKLKQPKSSETNSPSLLQLKKNPHRVIMIETLAKNVREASLILQSLSGQEKNRILEQIKSGLVNAGNVAKEANDKDVQVCHYLQLAIPTRFIPLDLKSNLFRKIIIFVLCLS